jgi:hypothetical protein
MTPEEVFEAGHPAASDVGVWPGSYVCRPTLASCLSRVRVASIRDVVRRSAGATIRIRIAAMSDGWLTRLERELNKHRTDP